MFYRFSISPHGAGWTIADMEACRQATAGLHVVRSWDHGNAYWMDVSADAPPVVRHPLLVVGRWYSGATERELNAHVLYE